MPPFNELYLLACHFLSDLGNQEGQPESVFGLVQPRTSLHFRAGPTKKKPTHQNHHFFGVVQPKEPILDVVQPKRQDTPNHFFGVAEQKKRRHTKAIVFFLFVFSNKKRKKNIGVVQPKEPDHTSHLDVQPLSSPEASAGGVAGALQRRPLRAAPAPGRKNNRGGSGFFLRGPSPYSSKWCVLFCGGPSSESSKWFGFRWRGLNLWERSTSYPQEPEFTSAFQVGLDSGGLVIVNPSI